MPETSEQYVARVLGYIGNSPPLDVLAKTPARLGSFINGVSDASLAKRPAPGKWSVGEILAHLADTEIVMGYRVRQVLQHSGVVIQPFDQEIWASVGRYQQIPAARSLERLRHERQANVDLLQSLSPEQWARHGIHAERGKESIEHISKLWAGHDLNHLRQVEAILAPA